MLENLFVLVSFHRIADSQTKTKMKELALAIYQCSGIFKTTIKLRESLKALSTRPKILN